MPRRFEPHWTFEVKRSEGYVLIKRTTVEFETLDDVTASFEALLGALGLEALPEVGLLVDLRDSPMRTDPEFERATRPYRETLFVGFGRGGVLVRTAAGHKQVAANAEDDGNAYQIFDDEEAALAHVRSDETSARRFVYPGDE